MNKDMPTTAILDGEEAQKLVQYIDELRELVGLSLVEAYGLGYRGEECRVDVWNRSGTRAVLKGEASIDEFRMDESVNR